MVKPKLTPAINSMQQTGFCESSTYKLVYKCIYIQYMTLFGTSLMWTQNVDSKGAELFGNYLRNQGLSHPFLSTTLTEVYRPALLRCTSFLCSPIHL